MIKFLELVGFEGNLDVDIKNAFDEVLEKGVFVNGKNVSEFESSFKDISNSEYCISCGNGMDALTILLKSLNLQHNSEVLVPAQTFIATFFSIIHAGLIPVPVDVNEADCLMSLDDAEKRVTNKTSALVFVNMFGFGGSHKDVDDFCKANGLKLVYDSAQSHLTEYDNELLSSLGSHAVSFYPGKNLGALGDGGAILTDKKDIYNFSLKYRNYGSSKKYVHDIVGVNSRLDEIQAAFLRKKITKLSEWTNKRRDQAESYLSKINNKKIKLPIVNPRLKPSWHIFPIRVSNRDAFQSYMLDKGVETLIHYPEAPVRSQSLLQYKYDLDSFPKALDWEQTEVSIPIGPHLGNESIQKIINVINEF